MQLSEEVPAADWSTSWPRSSEDDACQLLALLCVAPASLCPDLLTFQLANCDTVLWIIQNTITQMNTHFPLSLKNPRRAQLWENNHKCRNISGLEPDQYMTDIGWFKKRYSDILNDIFFHIRAEAIENEVFHLYSCTVLCESGKFQCLGSALWSSFSAGMLWGGRCSWALLTFEQRGGGGGVEHSNLNTFEHLGVFETFKGIQVPLPTCGVVMPVPLTVTACPFFTDGRHFI